MYQVMLKSTVEADMTKYSIRKG